MKQKLWLFQLLLIFGFSACFVLIQQGELGNLQNPFLREKVYPSLRTITGTFTNWKFKLRGEQPPKSKVVIVDIDDESLLNIGRWPWHRNTIAELVDRIFDAGAKAVGLDIVFSEEDRRVPEELAEYLKSQGFGDAFEIFETDPELASSIAKHRNDIVLGWFTDSDCQPGFLSFEDCPVTHEEVLADFPENFDKFSIQDFKSEGTFDAQATPILSAAYVTGNLASYNAVAKHAGFFNAKPDPDGTVRRAPLIYFANGKPYPSLALEVARVGLGEEIEVRLTEDHEIDTIRFKKIWNRDSNYPFRCNGREL